ncbi:MAG: ABC transporter permease [Nitrospinae bacterium]|nr:ABC transporter permease [Nitrospinota bacterium]
MLLFIFKRFLWGIPVLLTVATLTFGIMHIVPGGPFDREKKLPPEIKANVEAKYHLNEPVHKQYILYLYGIIKGDLGPSYKYLGRDVRDIIKDTFPVSIQLGVLALFISIILGIGTGIISGIKSDTWWDKVTILFATTGISLPNFILGIILILLFSHFYKILPPALWEGWRYMILPSITLGFAPASYIARLTRSSVIDVMNKDYIRTARAKGLRGRNIILKHVLKNSIMPVITILGPITAALVTGSFIVEYIFSIPGMGRFFVTAVTNRDYPLIMGVTLIYTVIIVLANVIVDILYTFLDPRVKLE